MMHLVRLILILSTIAAAVSVDQTNSEVDCTALIDAFLERRFAHLKTQSVEVKEAKKTYNPDDFVFFLHVPRTAGRSFWSCFLYAAFPPSKKCAKSYDSLRLELSHPDCRVLASHDDYSITDFFPDNFKVITQARDPVDRVISAYEFTAQVAARDFNPNATEKVDGSEKVRTRDVWPWMYLVQLFDRYIERSLSILYKRQTLFKERYPKDHEASLDKWVESVSPKSGRTYYYHRKTRESKWELEEHEKNQVLRRLNPYNNSLIIPLATFVEFPMVEDLINNAMTYQVLGLSNASYWREAGEIRRCSAHSKEAQEKLLQAAKAQLESMLHISLTHKLDESLQSIAATLGLGLRNHTWGGQPKMLTDTDAEADTEMSIEDYRDRLEQLPDDQLLQLLFKYRHRLDEIRTVARSKRRSQLTRNEFLFKWDEAVAVFEAVREIQTEVMKRRKEKGNNLIQYPASEENDKKHSISTTLLPSLATVPISAETPLWLSYQRCVNKSMNKQRYGKLRAMTFIALPDERRMHFTKQARKTIPQSTIDIIKEKNWMDVQLFEYAQQLYDQQLHYQKSHDLLEDIPVFKVNQTETDPPSAPKPIQHDEL